MGDALNVERRVEEVYEELVELTEHPGVLQHRTKNQRLKDALALIEYLRGESDENPLDDWFD
jgi:cell fate (sporulation/competence/biofilm development) regulator YmcA (YheA/YmcA/DUF963 family)